MEIISMEETTFDKMVEKIKKIADDAEELAKSEDYSLLDWLDNQDVCQILNVSKRTLQSFRDTGKLAYSRMENKIYYKPEDVDLFLNNYRTTKK